MEAARKLRAEAFGTPEHDPVAHREPVGDGLDALAVGRAPRALGRNRVGGGARRGPPQPSRGERGGGEPGGAPSPSSPPPAGPRPGTRFSWRGGPTDRLQPPPGPPGETPPCPPR